MLKYAEVKSKTKEFLAATRLRVEEFEALVPGFEQAYAKAYVSDTTVAGDLRKRKVGGGAKGRLRSIEDKLLFILVYVKTYPLQTMHGVQIGLSQSQTNETNAWIQRLLPVLGEAMKAEGMLPEQIGCQNMLH